MSTKKGKPKITKGKAEQSYVREQLRKADLAPVYDVAIAYPDNVVKSVRVAPRYAINASEVIWKMQRLNGCPTECKLRFPVSFEGVLWEQGSEVIEKRQDVIEG